MPTRARVPGAHRESVAAAPDPVRAGGPRRWLVSAGVLAVLIAIFVAGALVIDGGDDSREAAASGPDPAATPWTVSTLEPLPEEGEPSPPAGPPAPVTPAPSGSAVTPAPSGSGVDDEGPASPPASPAAGVAGGATEVLAVDRRAGLATTTVTQRGSGTLTVVPGSVPAPGAAPRMRVRVEVEGGIGADGPAFAAFVMDTLNDPRSWGHGGALSFARTDGDADIRVVLASPDTSAALCAPNRTGGTLSCGVGDRAIITMYRWLNGIPDYGDDRTGYRHYVVNHEVGHVLGHGHAYCDPGHLAPVMVQQTKGLHGCLANPWPFPVS